MLQFWTLFLVHVVLFQSFGCMALGALGFSKVAKLSPGEIPPPPVYVKISTTEGIDP